MTKLRTNPITVEIIFESLLLDLFVRWLQNEIVSETEHVGDNFEMLVTDLDIQKLSPTSSHQQN